jgi:parvulin-like peptidyl-prolyl isomerase
MIREELFVQRGRELDVASVDVDVRSATVTAVGQIVAADAIASVPTDTQLRAHYEAHKNTYASEGSILARDIVFADRTKAVQARNALLGGATIPAVAQRFGGRISGKLDGEEFYFAAQIHLGDRLFAVARALGDGEVSEPIAAQDGFHMIVMQKNNRPLPFTFSEVRGQVLTDFRTERIQRIQSEEEQFLRKRADIVVAEDLR